MAHARSCAPQAAVRPPALPRRDLVRAGSLGLFGLTLPALLRAQEPSGGPQARQRARSVIFLYQFGGPSHVDTFDLKPSAPDGVRSRYAPIVTSAPDISICDRLPQTAKVMDKVTLVRTVYHTMKNHNSASYYALTGHAPPLDDIRLRDSIELFPAYGSVVDKLSSGVDGMPAFVAYPYVMRDGSVTPGQHASFLGKAHDPLLITEDPNSADFRLPELRLPANLSVDRMRNRRAIQLLINQQLQDIELGANQPRIAGAGAGASDLGGYFGKALEMLQSPAVARAFDLEREPAALRERYGRTTYGQGCLLARRLVEAGVRFVNVYFSSSIGGQSVTDGGWDTHGFNNTRMYPILEARHLPLTDRTLPALLTDLDERGLLETTLVVWMGEFGRTPKLNANISRDHWPQCFTVLLAGGGVKRGYAHGRSDRLGAFPDRDGVPIDDLAATMFELMGIDPKTEIFDRLNRPLPIAAGRPVPGLVG